LKRYLLCLFLIALVSTAAYASYMMSAYVKQDEKWDTSSNISDMTMKILIDINAKMLYVVQDDNIIKKYPVATGKPDTPSPIGDFTIIQKERWGEGFGSAWLGLDVPWGKYGIHGTTRPGSIGHAASHGCIRMRNRDIDGLYKLVKVGTPVKIVGGMYGLL
jgi:lipoprotein-anchoring transpeptidase ErfK/SrfK